jgi:hypothetical protein
MYESNEYCFANNPGMEKTPVDAGQLNNCALPLRFIKIDPGMIKSAEIVDHGNHEFQWVMRFQVEALETLDSIGS